MTEVGPRTPRVLLPHDFAARFHPIEHVVALGSTELVISRPADAEQLIDEQDFARDERLPYWAELWPSALALGEFLLSHVGAGRTMLELGSGVGLVSLCAARAGYEVVASDYYADALAFCAANAAANGITLQGTRHLDWRAVDGNIGTFDAVVAADVLYERPYGSLVAQVIRRVLRPGGIAWLADPGRVGLEPFLVEATRLGLRVASRQRLTAEAFGRTHDITVFELTDT